MVDPLRPYEHVVPEEGTFNRGDGVPGFQMGQFDVFGNPKPDSFNFIGKDPTIDQLRELDAQNKLFDSSGRPTIPMTDTFREYMRERTGGRPIRTTIEAAKASPLGIFYSGLDTAFRTAFTELNKFQEFTLTDDQIESQVTANTNPIMGGVPNIGGFFYDNMLSTEKPTNDTVEYYADKEGLFRTKEFELSPAQKELKYKMDIAYKENQLGRDLGFFEKQRLYQDEHSSVPEYMIDALVLSAEILVPATATEKVIGLGLAKGVGKLVNNPATRKGVSYLPNWGEIVDNYTIKALEEVRIKNPKPKDMTDEDLWKTSVGYEVGVQTFDEQIDFVVKGGVDSKNTHLPSLEKQVGKPISEWSPTDFKKLEDDLNIAKQKATKFYDEIIAEANKRDILNETAILNAKTGTPFNGLMFRGVGEQTAKQVSEKGVELSRIFGDDAVFTYSRKTNASAQGSELSIENVHLDNPYVLETDDQWLSLTKAAGIDGHVPQSIDEIENLRTIITDFGYDGIVVRHPQNLQDGRRLLQIFSGDTVVSYKHATKNPSKTTALLNAIPDEGGVRLVKLAKLFGTETANDKKDFVQLIRELINDGTVIQNSDGTVRKSSVIKEAVDDVVPSRPELDGNPAGIDPAIAREAADHPVNKVMPSQASLTMDSPRQLPSGDDIKPPPQYSDMFDEMWGNAPRETMYALFQRRWIVLMENINDQFYGFRVLQRQVERMKAKNAKSKQDIKTGQREVNELQNRLASPAIKASQPKTLALRKKLDIAEKKLNDAIEQVSNTKLAENDLDFVTKITNAPGAIGIGATRAQMVFNELQSIGHIMPDDLNRLLLIARNRELHKLGIPLPGGRKIEQIEDSFNKLMARLNPQQKEELVAGAEVILKFYRDERDRLLHSGIISKELYDDLATNHPYYNPVKYIESAADAAYRGPGYPGFRNTNNRIIELTERTLNEPYERPLNLIGQVAIQNEATRVRNDLAKTMIKLGESFGREGKTPIVRKIDVDDAPGRHTLEYFEDGELFVYEVPAWMKREADYLVKASGNNTVAKYFGYMNGISRAAFTSLSPVFIPVNAMADVATALYTQRLLPHRTVAALYRMAKQGKNNHVAITHRLSGGYQQRFYGNQGKSLAEGAGISTGGGKSQEQIAKELENKMAGKWVYEGRPIGKKSVLGIIRENQPLALLSRAGEAVEQAPRQAFFKREIDNLLGKGWESKFTPEEVAQMPAVRKIAADSVELTLNFARGGYIIKELNPFVLFLNATLEGMKLPYRAVRQSRKAQHNLATMIAGQAALTIYNMGFPEYFDIPQRDRWGSLNIMLPPKEQNPDGTWKPNRIELLPYRDLALSLGGMTYFLEQFASDSPTDFKHFALATLGNSTPFAQIPTPPILTEIGQQFFNHNMYFGSPIVPPDVIDQEPKKQIMPYTNRTFEEIGEAIGQSPVRLESAFMSTLGSTGSAITSITDYIINLIDPRKVSPELANLITEYESFTDTTARRKWVHTLNSQQREDLFFELARPDDQLPLIGPIIDRFNPGTSGGMAERAEQEAEQATGISVEQTQSVYARTRMIADDHLTEQQDLDRRLLENEINGRQWRQGKADIGISYQSAINQASKGFPKSAQSASSEDRQEFYNIIKSLSRGADNETEKAQVIISGWYAITLPDSPLTEIGEGVGKTFVPSPEEWQILRQAQKEYRESLDEEELEILDNQIESGYTPLEAAYYQDSKLINEYYDYASTLLQPGSKLYPILEDAAKEGNTTVDQIISDYNSYNKTKGHDLRSAKKTYPAGAAVHDGVAFFLKEYRKDNYDLDKALYKWTVIDSPANVQLAKEYRSLFDRFNGNIPNRLYIDPQLMKELIPGLGSAIGGVVNGYN